ncbi:hypothetical protein Pst134EA_025909 [Puccinia striiformis f. sp. tritici]|uniref:hypothetical protein n=1 Tax=Puccinia striiformis f. sp. tritici TaxID=168172 RepID=UPI0020076B02|nr:hypothetical protein Pst134EA_025909 [Puccinia striiformis f. sp. tritici]KAH9451971.1 hypothetical protein Pst134EA_025909 [Puccinia striiformis f. sp. tritici]
MQVHKNPEFSAGEYFKSFADPHMFSTFKMDLIAAIGEFMGTFVFLLVGLGGIQAGNTSNTDNSISTIGNSSVPNLNLLMYVSTSMGLSLLFSCWIFFRATGAAFNPNVSLALLLIRIISPVRFVLYTTAQLLASIVASAVLQALLPGPLTVSTTLGAGTSPAQGLFIEGFITCGLVLSVLFLAVEKHKATFLAPIGIGITLFAGHLFALVYTGAGMNTARSFGPAVVAGFTSEHWIYWIGPTLGSLLAVGIYAFMKLFRYWKLSEGQDTDIPSMSPELFAQPAGPVGGLVRAADLERNEVPGANNAERLRWLSQSPNVKHQ